MRILDVEFNDINGGSFGVTAAHADSGFPSNDGVIERILDEERRAALDTLGPYQAFSKRVFEHRDNLRAAVDGLHRQGANIFGYGASTKGNVILQFCGFSPSEIPYIVEVNPDKFGSFSPGTGIPIISEAESRAMNPDVLLVLPWHLRPNVLQREAAFMDSGGEILFPLPEIELVGR